MRANPFKTELLQGPEGTADTMPGQGEAAEAPEGFRTLDELVATWADKAREWYDAHPHDQHTPMLVCVSRDGSISIVAAVDAFNGDEERKQQFYEYMRARMKDWNVVRYVVLVEAWFAAAAKKPEDSYLNDVMPSQRADRRECLMLVAADKDRTAGKMLKLQRNPHSGRVTGLVEDKAFSENGAAGHFAGRLSELLKEDTSFKVWWISDEELELWRLSLDFSNHGNAERFEDYEATLAEGKKLYAELEGAHRLQKSKLLNVEGGKLAAALQPRLVAFLEKQVRHWLTLDGQNPDEVLGSMKLKARMGIGPDADTVAKAVRRLREGKR